jgi:hypothetical protein
MMHPRTFVAQTTCAHTNHFYRSVIDALEFDGPAVVMCYTTCQPEHGVADDMATDQAKLAVDSRTFPLMIHDPRKGGTIRERLSLQGNPSASDDWYVNPKTGEETNFVDFARSEGRFSKHFDRDGNPSELLLAGQQDRLDNWHLLQELAGLHGGSTGNGKAAPKKAAKKATGNGSALPSGFQVGGKLKYSDGKSWIGGILKSDSPTILALEDGSEIEISLDIFRDAVAAGLVSNG